MMRESANESIALHAIESMVGNLMKCADARTDREDLLRHVCFRLARKNGDGVTSGRPHRDFYDMDIIYFLAYPGRDGIIALNVTDEVAEMLGADEEHLWRMARVNTPRIFPAKVGDITEFLRVPGFGDMMIASNDRVYYGAGVLLYEGLCSAIAMQVGGSFLIIPSSIHEVILLEDDGKIPEEELADMVGNVNSIVLEPKDILSDSVYRFDLKNGFTVAAGPGKED